MEVIVHRLTQNVERVEVVMTEEEVLRLLESFDGGNSVEGRHVTGATEVVVRMEAKKAAG